MVRRRGEERPQPGRGTKPGRLGCAALAVLVAACAGCASGLPRDPEGTLDRVQGGELRVGVSADPPWTEVAAPGATEPAVTGIEPTLVADFARALDAEVVWTVGGEESLVGDLADGRLDLVIGGLTEASPWTEQVALTRPYVTVPDAVGDAEPHVMAARMGENAFLVELETFLLAHDVPEVGS